MVLSCKSFFKELKTREIEFELGHIEKMEIYILRDEFKFLYETLRKYLKGVIIINESEKICNNRREEKKLQMDLDLFIEKYWNVYSKILPEDLPKFTVTLNENLSNAKEIIKAILK